MALILQSLSPERQYDLHAQQRQPKYVNLATTSLKIGNLGKAQQAYQPLSKEKSHE
jgi:hypothetical protein